MKSRQTNRDGLTEKLREMIMNKKERNNMKKRIRGKNEESDNCATLCETGCRVIIYFILIMLRGRKRSEGIKKGERGLEGYFEEKGL